MADAEHPRLILRNFLSHEECKELEFIHKSCCTIGYRPYVFSTTLSHLVATNSAHLILPFVSIRERLKEKIEEFFGCEYELVIEFTGLISWSRGASIGWHSDDNKPYLKQRDFTAVCYLNNFGSDFKGGLFHFRDGEPTTIMPMAGDVVMYTADSRNIHCVDEVMDGERLALNLWFSRDSSHDEDAKLLSLLSQSLLPSSNDMPFSRLPFPASSSMYWFSPNQASHQEVGFDIRWGRLHVLGFSVYSSRGMDYSSDFLELLNEALQLARGDQLFDLNFTNIMHALQVVQFYCWKAFQSQTFLYEEQAGKVVQLPQALGEKIHSLESVARRDFQLAGVAFGNIASHEKVQYSFDWNNFSAAITSWEDYTCKLHKELLISLPQWRTHQCIHSISS
ncbi:hypothetical protein SLA2020_456890 [Shorea laevis]